MGIAVPRHLLKGLAIVSKNSGETLELLMGFRVHTELEPTKPVKGLVSGRDEGMDGGGVHKCYSM